VCSGRQRWPRPWLSTRCSNLYHPRRLDRPSRTKKFSSNENRSHIKTVFFGLNFFLELNKNFYKVIHIFVSRVELFNDVDLEKEGNLIQNPDKEELSDHRTDGALNTFVRVREFGFSSL
jgi:hypothetical protein